MDDKHRYLAYFPGPKAENMNLLWSIISEILRDNANWRVNNCLEDSSPISNTNKYKLKSEYELLLRNVNEMKAEMKKNFPFYSPRYIGHMISDTTLPALAGYIAGLLYNPNNVTTEAATVTVDWEIQVCNNILEVLGYEKAPEADINDKEFNIDKYRKSMEKTFGWAHITSGGTSSNIEALWVARNIKYLPLAIRDVAISKALDITLKQADGVDKKITEFSEKEVLLIKSADAINLLDDYFKAVSKKLEHGQVTGEDIGNKAWEWLDKSKLSLSKGTGKIFEKYPPVVFVSGAGHYSIHKAADILGIGKENVQHVRVDDKYRMDIADLKRKFMKTLLQGKIPLAVIAIAGTTEEGAVDPLHEIINLRNEVELNNNTSFWVHIDGAWGGYMRTLFTPAAIMDNFIRLSKLLEIPFEGDINSWNKLFFVKIEERVTRMSIGVLCQNNKRALPKELRILIELIEAKSEWMHIVAQNGIEAYLNKLYGFSEKNKDIWVFPALDKLDITTDDRMNLVMSIVRDKMTIECGNYKKEIETCWDDKSVLSSYMAFPYAESITIDAHKMGYVPYSCGGVAYKDDRIRNFIWQKAPYITGIEKKTLVHYPPKHIVEEQYCSDRNQRYSTVIDSFAPFTLEGSKSGASACALWLAAKTIPLTLGHHGAIIKSTLMAAREFYEWISCWNEIQTVNGRGKDIEFEFIPLVKPAPDTNIINFIIKNNVLPTLKAANEMTIQVYKSFENNMGDSEENPYSRCSFFLSKTRFDAQMYPFANLVKFFEINGIENAYMEYSKNGLFVLRATIMNPYIHSINKTSKTNYFKEFMESISHVSERFMYEYKKEEKENES